jgi:hypothetical protein
MYMRPPLEKMTLEELLITIPEFVFVGPNDRLWLHIQPTLGRRTWNAFYGAVDENGMGVHPILRAEEPSARDALISLGQILDLGRFTLKEDPNGIFEEAPKKPSVEPGKQDI